MKIIPAIYLSHGNAVSNYKGQSEQVTVLSKDPLSAARRFEKEGAKYIHLVDLDAFDAGSKENSKIAKSIAKNTSIEVSYADGVSALQDVENLFADGIAQVCLGQSAINILDEAISRFGQDKIFFVIRTQRRVIPDQPGVEVTDYGRQLSERGVKNIILRDTLAEGTFHPNFDEVERLMFGAKVNVFAFGGVGSIGDLEVLQKTGVAGVIISKAFFENRLSLAECMEKYR